MVDIQVCGLKVKSPGFFVSPSIARSFCYGILTLFVFFFLSSIKRSLFISVTLIKFEKNISSIFEWSRVSNVIVVIEFREINFHFERDDFSVLLVIYKII